MLFFFLIYFSHILLICNKLKLEQYKVVFDDDTVLRQMLERHSSRAIDQFNHVVNNRYHFALSGAMR